MTSTLIDLRRRYISKPVLGFVRRILPRMSDTEREAIEAGTIGWDAELFSGKPDWEKFLGQGPARLSEEEQAFLDGPTEQLCAMIDDWEINFEHRDLPPRIWDFIKAQGFLGMIIPKEYGGLGFSASAHSAVVMKLSSRSLTAAVSVMVPNSLGPGELLMEFGTEEQKRHYLPRLADGRELPCFGLTSLEAGSDAAAMTDRGIVCYETHNGKKTLGMKVTWSKRYITLGPVATVLGLAFTLHDPDHILGEEEDLGITVALVPTGTPGVEIGRRHFPAGQAFQNGPNSGKDVFMPMEWIIGGQDRIGQGWKMLVSALAAGRGISLPSQSVAGAKLAAFTAGAYGRIRRQFNVPVGKFEGVQEVLARIGAAAYQLEAGSRAINRMLDLHEKPAVLSGVLKYHATERMREAINDAMDIHGGKGIMDGPRNYLGNVYKAIPVGITVEGANILTRSLIIYGQGAVRCHPYLLKEMNAARNPDREQALEEFDRALFGHIGFALGNFTRSLFHGLTGSLFVKSPVKGPTARCFRAVGRYSAAFSTLSETAFLTMGGALKRKEMISARLGDVLSELYLITAVLKRYEEDGRPPADMPLVRYCCQRSFHEIETRLHEVLANFPARPVAWILRLVIFPLGRWQRKPSDRTAREIAELMIEPSAARTRLTEGIFIGGDNDPLGQLDLALEQTAVLSHTRRKMRAAKIRDIETATAQGVITGDEAARLKETDALVREILMVDDFSQETLAGPESAKSSRTKAAPAAKPKTTAKPKSKPKSAAKPAGRTASQSDIKGDGSSQPTRKPKPAKPVPSTS